LSRKTHARIFWAVVAVLLILHVDVFNHLEPGSDPSDGVAPVGWLPWDMAYHLLWMVAAAGAVFYLTAKVWPSDS
jgi:hypothetical protein